MHGKHHAQPTLLLTTIALPMTAVPSTPKPLKLLTEAQGGHCRLRMQTPEPMLAQLSEHL
jgi:hypothetical protein